MKRKLMLLLVVTAVFASGCVKSDKSGGKSSSTAAPVKKELVFAAPTDERH